MKLEIAGSDPLAIGFVDTPEYLLKIDMRGLSESIWLSGLDRDGHEGFKWNGTEIRVGESPKALISRRVDHPSPPWERPSGGQSPDNLFEIVPDGRRHG